MVRGMVEESVVFSLFLWKQIKRAQRTLKKKQENQKKKKKNSIIKTLEQFCFFLQRESLYFISSFFPLAFFLISPKNVCECESRFCSIDSDS